MSEQIRVRPEQPPVVPLERLVDALADRTAVEVLGPTDGVVLRGISLSSAQTSPGDLYAALPGARTHGANYAATATSAGAVAILTDFTGAQIVRAPTSSASAHVPVVIIGDPRGVLAGLSAKFYGHPSENFATIGITGTQGKTTTSYLTEAALAGHRCAVVGTIGTRINGVPAATALTTPEAPMLQAMFAVMAEESVEVLAMEVSSHALAQGRVDGFVFDVAVFLNLARDHLDFHPNMEEYFAAKASLFTPEHAKHAVINVDDPYGLKLQQNTTLPTTTISATGAAADFRAVNICSRPFRTDLDVVCPDESSVQMAVPLAGAFNVTNAVAALAAAARLGFDPAELAAGISASVGVPGRMQQVAADADFLAIVDYAHKPDAVSAVLSALRPTTAGRLIIVIGAGGDRDKGKRPLMGAAAAELADVVIVTDDNPRSEDPAVIRAELIAGARGGPATVHEVADRAEAIAYAVQQASASDTVVVAGKGHEQGQQIGTEVRPFDDASVLEQAIAETR